MPPCGVPVLLFADANGRVGAQSSLYVGRAEADEVDVGGEELQVFVGALNLVLPSTFLGGGPTWQPAGAPRPAGRHGPCCRHHIPRGILF